MFETAVGKRLTLYLPDRDQHGNAVQDIELWVREASFLLATIAGGSTRTPPVKGIWYNDKEGRFVEETSYLIYAFCEAGELAKRMNLLQEFIGRFLIEANQQTVAVELGDRMYFVGHQPQKKPSLNGEARLYVEANDAR